MTEIRKVATVEASKNFDKYVTLVNVLILYTINSELLLERFVIFKYCSFNRTTAMTSRDKGRWRKHSSGAEESIVKKVKKVKGSLMEIHVNSTVWTPSLMLGCYGKLFFEGTGTAFQYVKSVDGCFPNAERTYRIMLTVPVSFGDFS
jgi:hypothetical protein